MMRVGVIVHDSLPRAGGAAYRGGVAHANRVLAGVRVVIDGDLATEGDGKGLVVRGVSLLGGELALGEGGVVARGIGHGLTRQRRRQRDDTLLKNLNQALA
jgi:hypothetical protein